MKILADTAMEGHIMKHMDWAESRISWEIIFLMELLIPRATGAVHAMLIPVHKIILIW